jgi:NLR family CARD domain-containing protein 3
MIHYEGSRYLA